MPRISVEGLELGWTSAPRPLVDRVLVFIREWIDSLSSDVESLDAAQSVNELFLRVPLNQAAATGAVDPEWRPKVWDAIGAGFENALKSALVKPNLRPADVSRIVGHAKSLQRAPTCATAVVHAFRFYFERIYPQRDSILNDAMEEAVVSFATTMSNPETVIVFVPDRIVGLRMPRNILQTLLRNASAATIKNIVSNALASVYPTVDCVVVVQFAIENYCEDIHHWISEVMVKVESSRIDDTARNRITSTLLSEFVQKFNENIDVIKVIKRIIELLSTQNKSGFHEIVARILSQIVELGNSLPLKKAREISDEISSWIRRGGINSPSLEYTMYCKVFLPSGEISTPGFFSLFFQHGAHRPILPGSHQLLL